MVDQSPRQALGRRIHQLVWNEIGLPKFQALVRQWRGDLLPLPVPRDRPLSLAEKAAAVAAVHDASWETGDKVDPWPAPLGEEVALAMEWVPDGVRWRRLLSQAESLDDPQLVYLDEMVASLQGWAASDATAAHSDDFRSARWSGQEYTFTAPQAACVAILWRNWTGGTPEVGGEYLAEAVECGRIADLFKGHPAWNAMIGPGRTKGSYRLLEPGD